MSSPRSSSTRPSSAPNEDLATYPRREAADAAMLEEEGCALLWAPDAATMYPDGSETTIQRRRRRRRSRRRRPARPFRRRRDGGRAAVRPGPARHRPVRREGLPAARRHPADGPRPRPGRRDRRRADPARRRRPRPLLAQRLSHRRGAASPRAPCRARWARRRRRSRAAATSPRRSPGASALPRRASTRSTMSNCATPRRWRRSTALDRPARLLAAARIGSTRLIDNLPVEPADGCTS